MSHNEGLNPLTKDNGHYDIDESFDGLERLDAYYPPAGVQSKTENGAFDVKLDSWAPDSPAAAFYFDPTLRRPSEEEVQAAGVPHDGVRFPNFQPIIGNWHTDNHVVDRSEPSYEDNRSKAMRTCVREHFEGSDGTHPGDSTSKRPPVSLSSKDKTSSGSGHAKHGKRTGSSEPKHDQKFSSLANPTRSPGRRKPRSLVVRSTLAGRT
ncbi:hypothetical protein T439DRAFT_353949 [Meredithblackwellia eburnea MCA 4105]